MTLLGTDKNRRSVADRYADMSLKYQRLISVKISVFICVVSAVLALYAKEAAAATLLNAPNYLGLSNGLVGYWTFDGQDSAGGLFLDRSGNGRNATSTSVVIPKKVVGRIGQALDFDGIDDYAEMSALSNFISASDGTIALWMKPTGPVKTDSVSYSLPAPFGDGGGFASITRGDVLGTNRIWAYNWDGNEDRVGVTYNPEEWVHIAWVHTGGVLTIYKNGVEGGSVASGNTTNLTANAQIGRGYQSATDNFEFFQGVVDDVRIYNRALSAAEIKRLYNMGATTKLNVTPKNSLTNGLVGYWTFDANDMAGERAYDRSGNGNTGLLTGGPTRATGKLGQALGFDGANDFVDAGTGSSLAIGTGDFTIAAWFKIPPGSAGGNMVTKNKGNCGDYYLRAASDASIRVEIRTLVTCVGPVVSSSGTYGDNTWHQVVEVLKRGDNTRLYIDGVQVGDDPSGTSALGASDISDPANFYIGAKQYAPEVGYFDGSLDDVRIYNRALSPDEIKRLYNMGATTKINVTPKNSLTNGLVGYWTFDGQDMAGSQAYDRSGGGNRGNLGTTVKRAVGKVGQALDFDGTVASAVNMGDALDLIGSSGLTLSAWIYGRTWNAYGGIIEKLATAGNYRLVNPSSNPALVDFGIRDSGGGFEDVSSVTALNTNQWYHVVATFDDVNTGKIYLNGVLDNTKTNFTLTRGNTAEDLEIGWNANNVSGFNGLIDDVRIYNRALSPDEIKRLYNMGR